VAVKIKLFILYALLAISFTTYAQRDISLYEQFNGRYDFTFVGNTLNPSENNTTETCTILTSSSARLTLNAGDVIEKAYLYWAGSGTGDLDVKLNGTAYRATRTFPLNALNIDGNNRLYFGAFANVTTQVRATGNGLYTLSDLDLTAVVGTDTYCGNKTNFGGWAIIIVYRNNSLPLNQLNLYDGMQYVPDDINISLPSLNVIDNVGAKIGFLAWEGDSALAIDEKLKINGTALSNALNPEENAFNSTNSVTNSRILYNMDLDIYNIQNYIRIGDQTAEISLESGRDFVMVNAVITKLNSQLPDATIAATNVERQCNSRTVTVKYTVSNTNSTNALPANTPIAIYINGDLVATTRTMAQLPIGGSERGTITINVPDDGRLDFELLLVVDDNGTGNGTVTETNEGNNTFIINVSLPVPPPLRDPADLNACDTGNGTAVFNFTGYLTSLRNEPTDVVTLYTTITDAQNGTNRITNTGSFRSIVSPQEIFVRLQNSDGCFTIGSFLLNAVDCLLPDATVVIGNTQKSCNSRIVNVNYTVNNFNSTDVLPAGTPITIYANTIAVATSYTIAILPIGGSESAMVSITIPDTVPLNFELKFVVDDTGNGSGIVQEVSEINNDAMLSFTLIVSPDLKKPEDIVACNEGFGSGTFDFSHYDEELKNTPADVVSFYVTRENAEQDIERITNTTQFVTQTNPQEIFVRLNNSDGCFTIGSFLLYTRLCPPETYNYVTPNGDGVNDTFFVKGLRNIFVNFKMSIYNRWGNLVWTGNNSTTDWDGIANEDKVGSADTTVPEGTYYFVLELNEPDYPKPIVGWVYVTK
jgi:gliding motility-associated-like protein